MVTETWRGMASGGGLQALSVQVVRARQEVSRKPWLFPGCSLSWGKRELAWIHFFKNLKVLHWWFPCISIVLSAFWKGPDWPRDPVGRAAASKHLLLWDLAFRGLVFDFVSSCWQHQGPSSARPVCGSVLNIFFGEGAVQWLLACHSVCPSNTQDWKNWWAGEEIMLVVWQPLRLSASWEDRAEQGGEYHCP